MFFAKRQRTYQVTCTEENGFKEEIFPSHLRYSWLCPDSSSSPLEEESTQVYWISSIAATRVVCNVDYVVTLNQNYMCLHPSMSVILLTEVGNLCTFVVLVWPKLHLGSRRRRLSSIAQWWLHVETTLLISTVNLKLQNYYSGTQLGKASGKVTFWIRVRSNLGRVRLMQFTG